MENGNNSGSTDNIIPNGDTDSEAAQPSTCQKKTSAWTRFVALFFMCLLGFGKFNRLHFVLGLKQLNIKNINT